MKIIENYLQESEDTKIIVKCVIKNHNNILLIRRAYDTPDAGFWDLPGGHVKEGEKEEEAVVREIKEEVGLNIEKPTSLKTIKINEIDCKIYTVKVKGPGLQVNLKPSNNNLDKFHWSHLPRPEHSEYHWVLYKDELERMPMKKELKDAIKSLLKGRKT